MMDGVRDLSPSCFSMVMATGIVSIAADLQGWSVVSAVLLSTAVVAYVGLALLTGRRWLRHRAAMWADLRSPQRSFGFFTTVAGTSVIGTALALRDHVTTGIVLLALATCIGAVLAYAVPACCLTGRNRGTLTHHADGTWFVASVAVQSLAVLAATLQPRVDSARDVLAAAAIAAWAVGVVLYVLIGLVVAVRLVRHRPEPAELTAPYWVGMGATAITVVAGSTILSMVDAPVLEAARRLIDALTPVFWAFGTGLIPVLLLAGYWRHVRHRIPLRYEVGLWSIVFPLGMYGVGSHDLGREAGRHVLTAIGRTEAWIALIAWALAFAAMCLSCLPRRTDQDLDG